MTMPLRSPPSRSVEELHGCIIVWDQDGQALAYVYYEDNPVKRAVAKLLTREKARQVAANIAKLPADGTPEATLAICERVAEVQALLRDHIECGKHTAADVVAKAQAFLSEPELLRAMFDVGYFPPNTAPVEQSWRLT
jgi:putative heme degradation protein